VSFSAKEIAERDECGAATMANLMSSWWRFRKRLTTREDARVVAIGKGTKQVSVRMDAKSTQMVHNDLVAPAGKHAGQAP